MCHSFIHSFIVDMSIAGLVQPTCPKTESTMGRSFLLSPSCSHRSSGSPTGEDRLKVLAFGLGGLFMLAELHRLNDSNFFLMEP